MIAPEILYPSFMAIAISVVHTVTGPDHYIPFIALAKTRKWTISKTLMWTVVCGLGHVLSSLIIGLIGIAIGYSVSSVRIFQSIRGGIASWAMLLSGLLYILYAFYQLRKKRLHKHFETDEEEIYVYEHRHNGQVYPQQKIKVTPYVMFIIFVLGPCEPLLPLLTIPAASQSMTAVITLVTVFTIFTLLTMITIVWIGLYGITFLKTQKLEKYLHVLAGSSLFLCGAGMILFDM